MGEHLGEHFPAVPIGVYYNRQLYYKSIKSKILLFWGGVEGGGVGERVGKWERGLI